MMGTTGKEKAGSVVAGPGLFFRLSPERAFQLFGQASRGRCPLNTLRFAIKSSHSM